MTRSGMNAPAASSAASPSARDPDLVALQAQRALEHLAISSSSSTTSTRAARSGSVMLVGWYGAAGP